MNLREAFHNKRSARGLTLIELLLVMALMSIIGLSFFPLGTSGYRLQVLDETREGLVSALRKAQSFSLTGRHDSSYGVKILPSAYIVFEGDSYTMRVVSEDEVFPIPQTISVTGFDEIVFSELSGEPSATGTLVISAWGTTKNIFIETSGNIE